MNVSSMIPTGSGGMFPWTEAFFSFQLKDALGIFVISTFLAYYLNITVEAPVAALDEMLFGGLRRTESKKGSKTPKVLQDRSFVLDSRQNSIHTKM